MPEEKEIKEKDKISLEDLKKRFNSIGNSEEMLFELLKDVNKYIDQCEEENPKDEEKIKEADEFFVEVKKRQKELLGEIID